MWNGKWFLPISGIFTSFHDFFTNYLTKILGKLHFRWTLDGPKESEIVDFLPLISRILPNLETEKGIFLPFVEVNTVKCHIRFLIYCTVFCQNLSLISNSWISLRLDGTVRFLLTYSWHKKRNHEFSNSGIKNAA